MKKYEIFLLAVTAIATVIMMVVTCHSWYMQYDTYTNQTDGDKYTKFMNDNYRNIKQATSLRTGFNPQFYADIENFDFTIDVMMNNINSSIIRYSPGQYCLSNSREGMAILAVIENSIDGFLQYDFNTVIKVMAVGSADGLLVRKNLTYDGQLGDLYNVKYYRGSSPNQPQYANFIKGKTRMTNEYFALLRAYDVISYLKEKYSIEEKNIELYVEEFSNIGSDYRRCDLSITLENVFMNDYNELGWVPKFFVDRKIKRE